MRRSALYLAARALLWLGIKSLAFSRRLDRWSDAAIQWSDVRLEQAKAMADRLDRVPNGDLLFGSSAIATHLGIPKATARHLIRSQAIPCFALRGVACARKSTLATHFAALEAETSA